MIDYSIYDKDYFETGIQSGKSGYQNYSWMPELTIRMAYYLIKELGISPDDKVLDFGCAKGYLVKALRILDINAYGVDVSNYAVSKADSEVAPYLNVISSVFDQSIYNGFTKVIAKDVLEHLPEQDIRDLLKSLKSSGADVFFAVPVAIEGTDRFVISQYHNDVTHITVKPKSWWEQVSLDSGYRVSYSEYSFPGVKENWVEKQPQGNIFVYLSGRE